MDQILASARELPVIKAKLEEIKAQLSKLESSQKKTPEKSDRPLSDSYKASILELEGRKKSIEKEVGTEIGRITEQNKILRREGKELEQDLKENEELFSQNAIHKETFRQKKKELGKALLTRQRAVAANDILIEKYTFYLENVGRVKYRRSKRVNFRATRRGSMRSSELGDNIRKAGLGFAGYIYAAFLFLAARMKRVKRVWYVASAFVILIIPVLVYWGYISVFVGEPINWQIAKIRNTEEAYHDHMNNYYKGKCFEKAASRHAALMWERVRDIEQPWQLEKVVFDFEDRKYFEMAKRKYDDLLWDSIQHVHTVEGYRHYLEKMKRGVRREEAGDSILSIERKAQIFPAPDTSSVMPAEASGLTLRDSE